MKGPARLISMLVPLLVLFAFQRYFVQGVLAGSAKQRRSYGPVPVAAPARWERYDDAT